MQNQIKMIIDGEEDNQTNIKTISDDRKQQRKKEEKIKIKIKSKTKNKKQKIKR